jgi:hypothetical protein
MVRGGDMSNDELLNGERSRQYKRMLKRFSLMRGGDTASPAPAHTKEDPMSLWNCAEDIANAQADLMRIKPEFPLYVIHLLKKAIGANVDIQIGDIWTSARGITGTFIINEPAEEGGEKEQVYDFEIQKRRGKIV